MKKISDVNFHNYLICSESFDAADRILTSSTWEEYYQKLDTFDRTRAEKEKQYEELKNKK